MFQAQEVKTRNEVRPNRLLTVDDVADQIGICKRTVYEWVADGRLPHFRLGRVLRFRQPDIDSFIDRMIEESRPGEPLDADDLKILDWADTVA